MSENPIASNFARVLWYNMCGGVDSIHGLPRINPALAQMFDVLGVHGCGEDQKQAFVDALRNIADALEEKPSLDSETIS